MTVSAYTNNFLFRLIDFASQNWSDDEHDNWRLVDALLQSQFGNFPFAVATGTATAVVLDYTPNVSPTVTGTYLSWQVTAASTGAMTVTIDGFGPLGVRYLGGAVAAGTLQVGDVVQMVFDGINYNITQPIRVIPSLVIKQASSGATALANADNLVIEGNVDTGLTVLAPDAAIGAIRFAAPSSNASITFNPTTARLLLTPGAGGRTELASPLLSGTISATNTVTITPGAGVVGLYLSNGNGAGIGVADPTVGSLTNTMPTTSGLFRTFTGTVSALTGVATDLFTTTDLGANVTYLLSVGITSGAPAAYSVVAIVSTDTGASRLTVLQTASLMTVTISGNTVRANQASGSTATIRYTLTRIS